MDSPAAFLTDRSRHCRPDPGPVGRALGLASLGIGVTGLVVPGLMSRLMRVERSTVWVIAVRDLASAWSILAWGGSPAFLSRALFDVGDAVLMVRRRPALALLAVASSILGFATHQAARRD